MFKCCLVFQLSFPMECWGQEPERDSSCSHLSVTKLTTGSESRCSLALNPPLSLSVLVSGMVSITGASLSVMQDQQVEFQCITSAWYPEPIVGWRLNGVAFNSSNTTIMIDGVSFDSTSVLTFQAVSNTTVECWATVASLSIPISSSVFLVVGKKIYNCFSVNVSGKKGLHSQV